MLTSSEKVMGKYKNTTFKKTALHTLDIIVTLLNIALFISILH